MSDAEHAASGPPAPVPESPPSPETDARPDQHEDTSARGSGDEAAPTSVDLRARQRPKLPVSDALARRLGGGRMPGKADRRGR